MGPIRRALLLHARAVRDQINRFRGSFQLFGCDLMISRSFEVAISECNTAPGMPEDVHMLPHKLAVMINNQDEMLQLALELDSRAHEPLRAMASDSLRLQSLNKFSPLFNEADMHEYLDCLRVGWRDPGVPADLSCPAGQSACEKKQTFL